MRFDKLRVLVTCPPMLGMIEHFMQYAEEQGIELVPAQTTQVLSEDELIATLPEFDGWIIGDDLASRKVIEAAQSGNMKAAVKWGIGVDNVDFNACKDLGLPIDNTPNMFGGEVADLAISYLLGLARETFYIDRQIRQNIAWPKPAGMTVSGSNIGVVGFGDIGENTVKRLSGFDVNVTVYDPGVESDKGYSFVSRKEFPDGLDKLDFLIFTCALNNHNRHMLNAETLALMKDGAKVINVARGPLINELDLIGALQSGKLSAAALDVFEVEPLPESSPLRNLEKCIFGSHNGSNTKEAVIRASHLAIDKLAGFLNEFR